MSELAAAIARLQSGYYNSARVSGANPGGMGDGGHVINFPAALKDAGDVIAVTADAVESSTASAAAALAYRNQAGDHRDGAEAALGGAVAAQAAAEAAASAAAALLGNIPYGNLKGLSGAPASRFLATAAEGALQALNAADFRAAIGALGGEGSFAAASPGPIGGTTPGTGAFTTLAAASLTISAANSRARVSHTGGTPSTLLLAADGGIVSFGSETDSPLNILVAGAGVARWTTNGELVLGGTAAASHKLRVIQAASGATARFESTGANIATVQIVSAQTGGNYGSSLALYADGGSTMSARIISVASGGLRMGAGPNDHVLIDASGNVGLSIAGTGGAERALCIANGVAPSSSIDGGIIYVIGGELRFRGGAGTVTVLAAA